KTGIDARPHRPTTPRRISAPTSCKAQAESNSPGLAMALPYHARAPGQRSAPVRPRSNETCFHCNQLALAACPGLDSHETLVGRPAQARKKRTMTSSQTAPRKAPPLGSSGGPGLDATSLLKALRKGWPFIVAAVLLCAGGSLLYWRSQPAVY